jgi:hypothetical protein
MLVKLTPGVNIINILSAAFKLVDPESIKILTTDKVSGLDCLFALLGSACIKAARSTLMKLTLEVGNSFWL